MLILKEPLKRIKNKAKLWVVTLATLWFLTWCWWWGGDWWSTWTINNWNSWWTNNWNEWWRTNSSLLVWQVQAGIVSWARILLETRDWKILLETTTDNNWKYSIDREELSMILESEWLTTDTELVVFSEWWIDIDPDDDWNPDNDIDIEVKWKMSSILTLNEIDWSNITPLSTYVYNEIKNQVPNFNQINSKELKNIILETIKKIWLIDKNDLIHYDMVSRDSVIENAIKISWFLDNIHSWKSQDNEVMTAVKNIVENLEVIQTSSNFSWNIDLNDKQTEWYASPELKAKKDELKADLNSLNTILVEKKQKLEDLKKQEEKVNWDISKNSKTLEAKKWDLNKLDDFEKKVREISFISDSDNILKAKVEKVPNISDIDIVSLGTRSLKTRSLLSKSYSSSSNSEIIATDDLESRKQILKEEIININNQIKQINEDIEKKENAIKIKERDIKNEEKKLEEAQNKVNKVEKKLDKFKKDNSEEIAEYKKAKNSYDKLLKELKSYWTLKNLYLDIWYIVDRFWIDYAKRAVEERQKQHSYPKSSDYQLDTTSKNYSDLWTFKEDVLDLDWKSIKVEIQYSYEHDYPAKIRFVWDKSSNWISNIKNRSHLVDYKKYVWSYYEKKIIMPKLDELEDYETTILLYDILLTALAEIELELDGTLEEYNNLKKSIRPRIDNLQKLREELIKQKNDLQDDKNIKRDLEYRKDKLIKELSDLWVKIEKFNNIQPLVKEEVIELEKEKINLSNNKKEISKLIVNIDNQKESINIEIWKKQAELDSINSEINANSELKSSLTATISMYWKNFRITINSDKIWWETEQQLEKALVKHLKQNTLENAYVFATWDYAKNYTYYPNWIWNFPAYIWWETVLYWNKSETEVYIVDSKEKQKDFVDNLNLNLNYNLKYHTGIEKHFVGEKIENSYKYNSLYVFKYEEFINYYYDWLNNKYPAKVWIEIILWDQKTKLWSNELAYSKEDEKIIIEWLLENIENNEQIEKVVEEKEVNKWKYIYVLDENWNYNYVSMLWWEYNIYKINWVYVWSYKVANRWHWHLTGVWKDLSWLEKAINDILDDWAERNGKNPVVELVDRSDSKEVDGENIENNDFSLWNSLWDSFKLEYENLYSELYNSCAEESYEVYPLVWGNSLDWNYKNQIEYTNQCVVNATKKEELKQKAKEFFNSLNIVAKSYIESLKIDYNIARWFWTWYSHAIYSQWTYLANLNEEELKKIKDDTLESLEKINKYIQSIWWYWSASIWYEITKDKNLLKIKNDLASKISFWAEIRELEELIKQIDWDYIEDKDYWGWYLAWYISEYMIVWKAIWMSSKWYARMAKDSLIKVITNLRLWWKLWKALLTPSKLNKKAFINVWAILWTWKNVEKLVKNNTSLNWSISTAIENLNFRSKINLSSNKLVIWDVFKWDLKDAPMSDIILEQLKFAWKDSNKITEIVLNNVVNDDIINIIKTSWITKIENNWWNIWGLDKMIVKLSKKLWKDIDKVEVRKLDADDWVPDIEYDIYIILK